MCVVQSIQGVIFGWGLLSGRELHGWWAFGPGRGMRGPGRSPLAQARPSPLPGVRQPQRHMLTLGSTLWMQLLKGQASQLDAIN